jgi:hypothetical protein
MTLLRTTAVSIWFEELPDRSRMRIISEATPIPAAPKESL